MELLPGIRAVGCGLVVGKSLVFSDVHLGYEKSLSAGEGLISRFQYDELLREAERALRAAGKLDRIILNGDVKHVFGRIEDREWRYALRFIAFLRRFAEDIVLIRGNHDTMLEPIARRAGVRLAESFREGDCLILHGDTLLPIPKGVKTLVIGHEHPALALRRGARTETFKCFLVGKWKKLSLVVMPATNPLVKGTDILRGERLSPFLPRSVRSFSVYVAGEETLDFGKVSRLPKSYF